MRRASAVLVAGTLLVAATSGRTEPPGPPVCGSLDDCLARLRASADPGSGMTPSEQQVADRLQALGPEAIAPVMELLRDPDGSVRELAGYVLRDMPGLGPEHLGELRRAVEAGDGWLPPAIAGIGTPEAVSFLVAQLKADPEDHTQFTHALASLGPAALPDLVELFRCGSTCDEALLRVTAGILSDMGGRAAEAVKPLEQIAEDAAGAQVARSAAIHALGRMGETARPAVGSLLELARSGPTGLKAPAQRAVLAIGGPGTQAVLDASLAAAPDRGVVLSEIAALGERGREAGPAVEQVLASSTEPDERVAAARTVGFIGYRPAAPALVAALADAEDWRLVYVAAEALGRLGALEAREALRATAGGHWYAAVRRAAHAALRALDAPSPPTRLAHPHEFFEFGLAEEEEPPACAEVPTYAPAARDGQTLDPIAQPALARQLAYARAVPAEMAKERKKGPPTIPEVGLRVAGGWLVGGDHGEWGGELMFKPDGGAFTSVLATNVSGLHLLGDGGVVAVTGLAHLVMDDGILYRVACKSEEGCTATRWRTLPSAPRSSWRLESGELLVNTHRGSLTVTPDGELTMLGCDAERRPKFRRR